MEGGAPARPGGGGGLELQDTSEAPPDHCGDQDTFKTSSVSHPASDTYSFAGAPYIYISALCLLSSVLNF